MPLMVRVSVFLAVADASVPSVPLRNGVQVPLVGAGTLNYIDEEAEFATNLWFDSGANMVDTGFMYHNQVGVGRAVAARLAKGTERNAMFIETKVPGCGFGDIDYSRCYEDTLWALGMNNGHLNLDYVDLVILHMPPLGSMIARSCAKAEDTICDRVKEQWRALEMFYKANRTRAIGVSNYCPSCFDCLNGTEIYPMLNQLQLHVGWGFNPRNSETVNSERDVVTQAYATLGLNPASHDPEILHGNLTNSIGAAHNKSAAQVALKWVVDQGIPVVVRSNNTKHQKENLDLFSWNFTAEEKKALDEAIDGSNIIPSFACDLWPGDEPASFLV